MGDDGDTSALIIGVNADSHGDAALRAGEGGRDDIALVALGLCDVVYSGGQAKEYLANMEVLVNGVNENRRGKKIYHGDIVETNGIRIEVK